MDGLNGIWQLFTYIANSDVGQWLPISPVQRFLNNWQGFTIIEQYLKYINWFVPVSIMLDILVVWLSAIGIFYAVMAILRWVRVVGD